MTEIAGLAIINTVGFVTGANRGLGRAFAQGLLDRGAAKVYAAARKPETVQFDDERVMPIKLDVTNLPISSPQPRHVVMCRS